MDAGSIPARSFTGRGKGASEAGPHAPFSFLENLIGFGCMICTASVWTHRGTDPLHGPLDLKIGYHNQPPVVRDWPKDTPIQVHLEQPDERTNLTIIKLSFCLGREIEKKWYNIRQYRIHKDSSLKCYIRARVANQMEHPIPRGRYTGTCQYTDEWCLFTLQAMTMKLQPKEPLIVLPDASLPAEKIAAPKTRIVLP